MSPAERRTRSLKRRVGIARKRFEAGEYHRAERVFEDEFHRSQPGAADDPAVNDAAGISGLIHLARHGSSSTAFDCLSLAMSAYRLRMEQGDIPADEFHLRERYYIDAVERLLDEKVIALEGMLAASSFVGIPGLGRMLLERGADPLETGPEGTSVLDGLAASGDLDAMRICLDAGCDPRGAREPDPSLNYLTPLRWSRSMEMSRLLIEAGARVHDLPAGFRDFNDQEQKRAIANHPFIACAHHQSNPTWLRMLLEAGDKEKIRRKTKALIFALSMEEYSALGKVAELRLLLEFGGDPDFHAHKDELHYGVNSRGLTLLDFAVEKFADAAFKKYEEMEPRLNCIRLLLEFGAKARKTGRLLLCFPETYSLFREITRKKLKPEGPAEAAALNDLDRIQKMLKKARTQTAARNLLRERNSLRQTPLDIAVEHGHEEMAMLLRSLGAVPDRNTLERACFRGLLPITRACMNDGLKVMAGMPNGNALHEAVRRPELLRFLLDNGVPVNEALPHGSTPLDLAIQYNLQTSANLLRARGGIRSSDSLEFPSSAGPEKSGLAPPPVMPGAPMRMQMRNGYVDVLEFEHFDAELILKYLGHGASLFIRGLVIRNDSPEAGDLSYVLRRAGTHRWLSTIRVGPRVYRRDYANSAVDEHGWGASHHMDNFGDEPPALQSLTLLGSSIEFEQFNSPTLRRLDLRVEEIVWRLENGEPGLYWPALESLSIHCRVTVRAGQGGYGLDPDPFLKYRRVPRLRRLRFRYFSNSDALCARICVSPLAFQLQYLEISRGDLTDRGLQSMLKVRHRFRSLRYLDLRQNQLSLSAREETRAAFKDIILKI